jgi:glucose-6-phosphate isomerase
MKFIAPHQTSAWQNLTALAQHHKVDLRTAFAENPSRAEQFSIQHPWALLDFSKQRIDADIWNQLIQLATATEWETGREAMFNGAPINATEGRAVLHTALRHPNSGVAGPDGKPVGPAIHRVLEQMKSFSKRVVQGDWRGWNGQPITDVVNIGIGGSDLGPAMAYEALWPYRVKHLRGHFVSNVDGAHIQRVLESVDPSTTLFIIASKTFTTEETMMNAHTAREWFLRTTGADAAALGKHFVALSTNQAAAEAFGILPENTFAFWDWVGGRYSMWSSIGLSLSILLGHDHFEALLRGAHALDQHFQEAPATQNLPLAMALLSIWNTHFEGFSSEAVIPYDQRLLRFPAYLQQLSMESNGKSVARNGQPVAWQTAPVLWGEPGTNGQHAFFQQLHQGTIFCPVDFIAVAQPNHPHEQHHRALLANVLAQSQALMNGKTSNEARQELIEAGLSKEAVEQLTPFKTFPGNRPSSTLMLDNLSPERLGFLVALYEQKVFCFGWIMGLYSFDQWGVELGKQLAKGLKPALEVKDFMQENSFDSSTKQLINWYIAHRNKP